MQYVQVRRGQVDVVIAREDRDADRSHVALLRSRRAELVSGRDSAIAAIADIDTQIAAIGALDPALIA